VKKTRVGVVGVGALGKHHARFYSALPDADLAGVVDIVPDRAAEVAQACNTAAFEDYRELFGRVDAVSIVTPTTLHGDIGSHFLEEGIHVLVEKPISHSLEAADQLIEAAEANGRVLQVGHLERFNPAVQAVKEIVQRPRFFEVHRMGVFSPRSLDIDVVLDLMIHDLDIISLLTPSRPVKIEAVGIAILSEQIDIANARIQFDDGCVANVTASRVSTEKIRKLRLFHARQYISLDYSRQDVALYSLAGVPGGGGNPISIERLTPPNKEPLEEELIAFLASVRGDRPVPCTGEDGKKTLAIALTILEQAQRAQAQEIDRQ
jgi:predicted dehydrogenase